MTFRIKSISVSGIRTLDDFKLELDGLMVLIGENGSGKSTIVEVCELMRRLPGQNFWNEFNQVHGGATLLQRKGAGEIKLGVEVDGDSEETAGRSVDRLEIVFGRNGIISETIWKDERVVFQRVGNSLTVPARPVNVIAGGPRRRPVPRPGGLVIPPITTAFSQPALSDPHALRLRSALQQIDVQVPFASTAYWLSQSQGGRLAPLRDSVTIAPTNRLERPGLNLANAFYSLKDEHRGTEWEGTMDLVRLGLGDWVESINLPPDAGGERSPLLSRLRIATHKSLPPASPMGNWHIWHLSPWHACRHRAPFSSSTRSRPICILRCSPAS